MYQVVGNSHSRYCFQQSKKGTAISIIEVEITKCKLMFVFKSRSNSLSFEDENLYAFLLEIDRKNLENIFTVQMNKNMHLPFYIFFFRNLVLQEAV